MKVKIFNCHSPLEKKKIDGVKALKHQILEDEINVWLQENPSIKISNIEQSASGGSFSPSMWLISIWYEHAEE